MQVIEDDGRDANFPMVEKAKQHLARLTGAFKKFLVDSAVFYQDILKQVCASPFSALNSITVFTPSYQHCFLFPARSDMQSRRGERGRKFEGHSPLSALCWRFGQVSLPPFFPFD